MLELLKERARRLASDLLKARGYGEKTSGKVQRPTDTEKAFHGIIPQTWWEDGYGGGGRKKGSNV